MNSAFGQRTNSSPCLQVNEPRWFGLASSPIRQSSLQIWWNAHARRSTIESPKARQQKQLLTDRRVVRVDPQFFAELDAQLGEERGPHGRASSSDFLLIDLPPIAEEFAENFEALPTMYVDRTDYRYLVSTGRLIAAALIVGQLMHDGTIALVSIEIDIEIDFD